MENNCKDDFTDTYMNISIIIGGFIGSFIGVSITYITGNIIGIVLGALIVGVTIVDLQITSKFIKSTIVKHKLNKSLKKHYKESGAFYRKLSLWLESKMKDLSYIEEEYGEWNFTLYKEESDSIKLKFDEFIKLDWIIDWYRLDYDELDFKDIVIAIKIINWLWDEIKKVDKIINNINIQIIKNNEFIEEETNNLNKKKMNIDKDYNKFSKDVDLFHSLSDTERDEDIDNTFKNGRNLKWSNHEYPIFKKINEVIKETEKLKKWVEILEKNKKNKK